MNVLISPRGIKRRLNLSPYSQRQRWLARLSLVLLVGSCLFAGYYLGDSVGQQTLLAQWKSDVAHQQSLLEGMQGDSEAQIEALTQKIAYFQAYINRLEAIGNKLMITAEIEDLEIDFSVDPGFGGPVAALDSNDHVELLSEMEQTLSLIESELQSQQNKLLTLDAVLSSRKRNEDSMPSGRPIRKGWISSNFGERTDPFTGRKELHKGIDFAGKHGADVLAVADGIVTAASKRAGYGNLIEIDHGNGYLTRYGHNKSFYVSPGQIVKRGDVVAAIGSTGRSTGPHVHFEVLKNGHHVNPMQFLSRSK